MKMHGHSNMRSDLLRFSEYAASGRGGERIDEQLRDKVVGLFVYK